MRYIKPDYYDSFRCTADKCPDTCCAGWQIVIDDDTMIKYAGDRSPFESRLKNGIDWREGCFLQNKGRCAMLNEKNLCDLIMEKGEDWLCETCNRYPRHVEEYEGLREWSLSLSCPEAAAIMLNRAESVSFVTQEDEEDDPLEEEFEDFDFLLFTQLEDARAVLLQIAQNRQLNIDIRLELIMEMAKQMQMCVEEERLYDMDELIRHFAQVANKQDTETVKNEMRSLKIEDGEERFLNLRKRFEYLEELERLREDWQEVLSTAKEVLYCGGYEQYENIHKAFQVEFGCGASRQHEWETVQEQLLVFFLFTYFCGAVYDDWIYSKAALAVFSVRFIQELVMCRWYLADKHIDMHDYVELSYRYAREVEHSDENLNLLEEFFQQEI